MLVIIVAASKNVIHFTKKNHDIKLNYWILTSAYTSGERIKSNFGYLENAAVHINYLATEKYKLTSSLNDFISTDFGPWNFIGYCAGMRYLSYNADSILGA
jgi:hypothetical protein